MRKLLYLAYNFPPVSTGGASRNLVLARYLPVGGWEMVPFTASNHIGLPMDPTLPDHLPEGMKVNSSFHLDPLHLLASAGRAAAVRPEGKTPRRVSFKTRLKRFLCHYLILPDRAVTWALTAVPAATRTARREKTGIVMSFGPQHSVHLISLAVARLCGLPFVSHFGDLWAYDSLVDWKALPAFTVRVNKWLERFVVLHSDGIVTTTPLSSQYFRTVYGIRCPPTIDIPNGYDPRRIKGMNSVPEERDRNGSVLRICYTGFFIGQQTPEPFLKGLGLFRERNADARILFKMVGSFGEDYDGLPRALGVEDLVEIVGQVPFSQVITHQRDADVLMVCLPPLPGSEVKMPSKLAEYLLWNKPLLAVAPEGDLTRTVRELSAGYCCAPIPGDVCATLERIFSDFTSGRLKVDLDSDEVADRFDMSILCVELGRFLDSIADGGGQPIPSVPG
ncbi:MAG: glycosyltransferase [Candidatus Fermentibacteraceae bacterium]